jgi:hypothetical protein
MKPITFAETRFIPRPAGEIAAGIADLSRWSEFGGYGPLPGIARPALWLIACLMRRALARHLAHLARPPLRSPPLR